MKSFGGGSVSVRITSESLGGYEPRLLNFVVNNRSKMVLGCLLIIVQICLNPAFISSVLAQDGFDPGEICMMYYIDDPEIKSLPETQSLEDTSESYELITIPELNNRIVPGEPIIPYKTSKILLPLNKDVANVEVIPGEQRYLGKFLIAPGQAIASIGRDNSSEPEFLSPNEEIYKSTEPYPEELFTVIGVQNKCGYGILYVNLYPICYIPKTGDVYYTTSFHVNVTTTDLVRLNDDLFRGAPQDQETVSQMVDNPDVIATYVKDFESTGRSYLLNGDYDYVIITSEMLKGADEPNFQTLADWKNQRGVRTAIVTVEEIYGAYKYIPHKDDQEMIRNFIRDVFQNNNVTYILLGGDGDGARIGGETWPDNTVPSRSLRCCWIYGDCPPSIASDLYYACLDGNFNANGNQIYGEEEDDTDLLAEVYVGRAPVDSAEELNNFVRKTISYESTDPSDPRLGMALMVGQYIGWPFEGEVTVWGGNHKDAVIPIFPDTFNIMTLYDRDYIGSCATDDQNWPKSELIDRINHDELHIINHVGTTNFCDAVFMVMKMGYMDADALKNEKYFFGYSVGSWAGAFDNKNPEDCYLPHDCVLEHFVTAPCGAFAFIGYSGYGWAEHGTASEGPSDKFDQAFWSAVFDDNILNLGRANQLSKETNIGLLNDTTDYGISARRCYYGTNLLGDPETSLILPPAATSSLSEMVMSEGPSDPDPFLDFDEQFSMTMEEFDDFNMDFGDV
jgi:hypothetical protein